MILRKIILIRIILQQNPDNTGKQQLQLTALVLINGDCTICMEMLPNGYGIITEHTTAIHPIILLELQTEVYEYIVEAAGMILQRT